MSDITVDIIPSISDPVAIDVANIDIQGYVASKTVQFSMFTSNINAVWAARKELRKQSFPFMLLTLVVNRNAFPLEVGDCFKFSYAPYGISNLVCRVLQKEEENPESEKIVLYCMEDIYSLVNSPTVYSTPTAQRITPIDYTLEPFSIQTIKEVPYVWSEGDIWALPLAAPEVGTELGFDIYMSVDGGVSYLFIDQVSNVVPYGELVEDYSGDTYTIDTEVGIVVEFSAHSSVTQIETATWAEVLSGQRNLALLGNEIISFQSITPISGRQYKLEGIVRGRYGSTKDFHSAGEGFYYLAPHIDYLSETEFTVGTTRYFKFVPFNSKYTGDVDEAEAISLTFEGLARTPYTPINFTANGSGFAPRYSGDIVLRWSPRLRGSGAGIGSPGTVLAQDTWEGLFKVEVWVGGLLKRTTTNIDNTTWTYTTAMNIADNGLLGETITFKLYNYIEEGGITYQSSPASVTVKYQVGGSL